MKYPSSGISSDGFLRISCSSYDWTRSIYRFSQRWKRSFRLERTGSCFRLCILNWLRTKVFNHCKKKSSNLYLTLGKNYPGYQRFFSRAVGIFGVGWRPGNCARKVSGTQGKEEPYDWKNILRPTLEFLPHNGYIFARRSIRNTCEDKTTTTNQWGSAGSFVDLDQ